MSTKLELRGFGLTSGCDGDDDRHTPVLGDQTCPFRSSGQIDRVRNNGKGCAPAPVIHGAAD